MEEIVRLSEGVETRQFKMGMYKLELSCFAPDNAARIIRGADCKRPSLPDLTRLDATLFGGLFACPTKAKARP